MIDIKISDYKYLPDHIKQELKRMTLAPPNSSEMRRILSSKKNFKVTLAYKNDTLVGWASITYNKYLKNYDFNIYIKSIYRKQGIGTQLYNVTYEYIKNTKRKTLYVQPWNAISSLFFRKVHYR